MPNIDFTIIDGRITPDIDFDLTSEQIELINELIVKYFSKLRVKADGASDVSSYPEGCTFYDGHLFKVFTDPKTWKDAKNACRGLGGHLATSTSAEKNEFLSSLAGGAGVWLGATDTAEEGTWKWVTGEDWGYMNWSTGQPDNIGGAEHYLELNFGTTGKWNDWSATGELGYICEWDYEPCINIDPKDIPHEKLDELLGGADDGHYHITEEESTKLGELITTYFPDGAEEPVIPSGGGGTGGGSPAWTQSALPATFSAYEGAGHMYYGSVTTDKSGEETALIVPMHREENGNECIYALCTTDLLTWTQYEAMTSIVYGRTLGLRFFANWNKSGMDLPKYKYFYLMFYPNTTKKVYRRQGKSSSTTLSTSGATSINAGCYSPELRRAIFVSEQGKVSRMYDSETSATKVTVKNIDDVPLPHCGLSEVNPDCAIWIPTQHCFCITGKGGVSTSETSDAGSWVVHSDAPKDLRGLTFRDDLGCAFAWSGEDKLFYKSGDGQNWEQHNSSPIPLDEVRSVAYSPEFGMYCAAGDPESGGNYAYFSKDLASWTKSKVSGTPLKAESVVWMDSVKKFVLLPNSGTFLYTFDPAGWQG